MRELRTSSYRIIVPLQNDQYVLLHGYSGAIDIVGKDIMSVLENDDSIFDEVFDKDTLDILQKRAYLTTKTEEEEQEYVRRLAEALHRKDKLLYASFTALITYDCNFRCSYCFERNPAVSKLCNHAMTKEMADKMFGSIEKILSTKEHKTTNILLFGGEPLLAENKHIVNYIVDEGTKRGYTFEAITNGYNLDVFVDLLAQDKIKNIQVTIDGMEMMHNSKRVHKDGIPTFSKIVSNVGLALDRDIRVVVRYNTDRKNTGQLVQLKEYFDKLGYTKNDNFVIDSARLMDYDNQTNNSQFFSQEEFIKEHEQLNFEYACHDYNMYSRILAAIQNKKPLPYSSTFCGSQSGNYVFDPFGKVYPCLEVVGKSIHQIGDYTNGTIEMHDEERQKWRSANVMSYSSCRKCKYALLCGGGCYANNIASHRCLHMGEIINYAVRRAYGNINI